MYYIATSRGFNRTLDPAFRFFDYFAFVCHVLQDSFLYSFVHVVPGSDLHTTLAVHELQHQAISFFLDTNHILVFEDVSLDYHVKLAACFKCFNKWQLMQDWVGISFPNIKIHHPVIL